MTIRDMVWAQVYASEVARYMTTIGWAADHHATNARKFAAYCADLAVCEVPEPAHAATERAQLEAVLAATGELEVKSCD